MKKINAKRLRKSVVMTSALILFLSGGGAFADTNWDNFTNQATTSPANMQLNNNAAANSQLALPPVPGGYKINGNGHTITADNTTPVGGGAAFSGSVINNSATGTDGTTITNTHFQGSDTGFTGMGGAVNNSGSLTVDADTKGGTSFTNHNIEGSGGAIYSTGTLKVNNANFSDNTVRGTGGSDSFGGAIYSNSTLDGTTLHVTNSTFDNNSALLFGGAIASMNGSALIEDSTFTNNSVTGNSTQGGAIINSANMVINRSEFYGNRASALGGAVSNGLNAQNTGGSVNVDNNINLTINNSDFHDNFAEVGGGALYNAGTRNQTISNTLTVNGGSYTNNIAELSGGAIYNGEKSVADGNDGVLIVNNATFNNNSTTNGTGGAIRNYGTATIKGSNFISNGVDRENNNQTTSGGAIYNGSTVGSNAQGEAIITISNALFQNNQATSRGGAIYNENGTVTIQDSTMVGNRAADSLAAGGAIYTAAGATTNVVATNGNRTVIGNNDSLANVEDSIRLSGSSTSHATVNFEAQGSGVIELNSEVSGADQRYDDININKNAGSNGLVHFRNDANISGANISLYNGQLKFDHDRNLRETNTLNMYGGTLNLLNHEYGGQLRVGNFNLMGDSNIMLDVDLENERMDSILQDSTVVTNPNDNDLYVTAMNSVSEAKTDNVRILFTDAEPLVGNVKLGDGANIVQAPIHKYEVKQETVPYPAMSGGSTSGVDPGEYFVFNRIGDSDPIISAPVAAQAAFLLQDNIYRQSFANMDMVTLMTPEQRMAWKMRNKYASAYHTGVFAPNVIPEERDGFYIRPFANFENVPLKNGPKVSNVFYGTLIGGESDLIELGHGWDGNFSFFGAYHGSHQAYNGVDIWQNGGSIGGVATAYKGNFWTGITANIGASAAQSSHMFGNDDFPILMTGAAWKSGYNFGLFNNKMVIQPSYMMSYTMVNVFDYTTSIGVRVTQDPLHAIEIIPGLRIIGNLKNGWQPYLGVNMTWNLMDRTKFYADDVALTELSVKPYVEYGVGIMKRQGDRFTGFGQAMIRNGGRNGIAFTLGMRWALGH